MERLSSPEFIVTCEHASNRIPDAYADLFSDELAQQALHSHRGWDPGALDVAEALSQTLHAPLLTYPYTRLLIEPNRSEHHPTLFSEFSRVLPEQEKKRLIEQCYRPYRQSVMDLIRSQFHPDRPIIHLSIHSFTPVLDGHERHIDIGLLYDPSRPMEKAFCRDCKQGIQRLSPTLRIRMNQPYKGISDGFTTFLRKQLGDRYSGIELEVNQNFFTGEKRVATALTSIISEGIQAAI